MINRINRYRFEIIEERLRVFRFAVDHAQRPGRRAHADGTHACARERGDVRRAKLYYLRDRVGKAAKVREKRV